jgi:large subunit ribosomal protein L24
MLEYKKLKKNDLVKIISGKERVSEKTGKVIDIDRVKGKVLVEGANLVKKAIRKSKTNQVGGIKEIEAFLDISNVMLICPKCKKPARVGFRLDNGIKKRVCKKCKADID